MASINTLRTLFTNIHRSLITSTPKNIEKYFLQKALPILQAYNGEDLKDYPINRSTSYNNECDVVRISIHSTQLYNAYFNYWPGGSTQYTVSKIDDKNIKNPRLRKVLFGELKECKYINNGVSNRLVSSRYLQADDTEYYTVNQFVMNKLENPFLEGATTLHIDSKM
tara:strand:- start:564 stop:1064 length:501 start_codon:yes stop_codon:yes gene_type:complete